MRTDSWYIGVPFVLGLLLQDKILGDEMLLQGNIVQSVTGELGVTSCAVLTWDYLELVHHVLVFVLEEGVHFEVKLRVLEDGDELVVVEEVYDGVYQRLDLEVGPLLCDEMEVDEEGVVLFCALDAVNDLVVETAVHLVAHVPYLSALENEQVVIVVNRLQNLLRVRDVHLNLFSQGVECLLNETAEEDDVLEDGLVGFF